MPLSQFFKPIAMSNEVPGNQSVRGVHKLLNTGGAQLQSPLCNRCSQIDFTDIFAKRHRVKDTELHYKLGPFASWNIDSCALCTILSTTMKLKSGNDQPTKTELWSYTTNLFSRMNWIRNKAWIFFDLLALKIEHNLTLQPEDEIYIFSQYEDTVPVRPLGPFIEFGVVKAWTTFCQQNHIKTCGDAAQPLSALRATIQYFKVINCETRKIIDAPEENEYYVALSYTWGQISDEVSNFHSDLPKPLPLTIENALEVTIKLGFKYLWVDRYCIDQSDTKSKLEQIYNMDLIYNGAWITIIAAAGKDPMHGLPGFERTPRSVHPHVNIGTHLLASTLGNPMKEILDSTWFQRGWTYQEGLLSRRRLFFTDHQAYFECAGMYCCENQNVPLDQLHMPDGEQFEAKYCNDRYVGIFPRQIATTEWDIIDRINIYSTRRFSHSADILNGFLGILRSFEKSSVRLRHCFGVPIFSHRNPNTPVIGSDSERYPPVAGFCLGLNWGNLDSPERRVGFPSWSWTGWIGEPSWYVSEYWWSNSHGDPDMQIQFQLHNGHIISWEDFHQRGSAELGPQLSNVLRVSAWVWPIDLRSLGYYSERNRWNEDLSVSIEALGVLVGPLLLGVPLVHRSEYNQAPARTDLMIIQEVEPGIYERVGTGSITQQRNYGDISKYWKEFKLR